MVQSRRRSRSLPSVVAQLEVLQHEVSPETSVHTDTTDSIDSLSPKVTSRENLRHGTTTSLMHSPKGNKFSPSLKAASRTLRSPSAERLKKKEEKRNSGSKGHSHKDKGNNSGSANVSPRPANEGSPTGLSRKGTLKEKSANPTTDTKRSEDRKRRKSEKKIEDTEQEQEFGSDSDGK